MCNFITCLQTTILARWWLHLVHRTKIIIKALSRYEERLKPLYSTHTWVSGDLFCGDWDPADYDVASCMTSRSRSLIISANCNGGTSASYEDIVPIFQRAGPGRCHSWHFCLVRRSPTRMQRTVFRVSRSSLLQRLCFGTFISLKHHSMPVLENGNESKVTASEAMSAKGFSICLFLWWLASTHKASVDSMV